jgi:hypothetical protein
MEFSQEGLASHRLIGTHPRCRLMPWPFVRPRGHHLGVVFRHQARKVKITELELVEDNEDVVDKEGTSEDPDLLFDKEPSAYAPSLFQS